jgi:AcrR family transcriptional regulator
MSALTEHCRRERILNAAEEAFAASGFEGASLRDIVLAARVNLATVYYYFSSKRGLMEAVLKRRFGPLREAHLSLLRASREKAGGKPLSLEAILEAMLLPPLRLATDVPEKREAVRRLIGRIATEPDPQTQEILRSQRAEVREAFLEALQDTLPSVPRVDLQWRMEFIWGALTFILCDPRKLAKETEGACDPVDVERVLAEMISFFSPGLRELATLQFQEVKGSPNGHAAGNKEDVRGAKRRRSSKPLPK